MSVALQPPPWRTSAASPSMARMQHGYARARVAVPLEASEPPLTRLAAMGTLLLGFVCMFPYPAFPIGNNTALQIGNAWSLLLFIPAILHSWKRRPFYFFPVLMVPMLLAALKVTFYGPGDVLLCLKETAVWFISGTTLVCVQWYGPRYMRYFLTGTAFAALVHAAVGYYQEFTFLKGMTFPFLDIYYNPSFQDVRVMHPEFEQRPFGLFPEPSAMASSLAPWVLFWCAELMGLVRLKQQPRNWERWLWGTAALASVVLMLLSRSGHSGITMIGLLVLCVMWAIRCRANSRNFLIIAAAACIVLPAGLFGAAKVLESRTGGSDRMGNDSWQSRTDSMVEGFKNYCASDPLSLVLGRGPGMASAELHDDNTGRFDAIWSIILPYFCDTGIVGGLCITYLMFKLLRAMEISPSKIVYASILFVWLVGVVVTTSYPQLLSVWSTLGLLSVWPMICAPTGHKPLLAGRL